MNDKQKELAAKHGLKTIGCQMKPKGRSDDEKSAPDKHKLRLVAPIETEKIARLSSAADPELRKIISAMQKRKITSTQDEDFPPAA